MATINDKPYPPSPDDLVKVIIPPQILEHYYNGSLINVMATYDKNYPGSTSKRYIISENTMNHYDCTKLETPSQIMTDTEIKEKYIVFIPPKPKSIKPESHDEKMERWIESGGTLD